MKRKLVNSIINGVTTTVILMAGVIMFNPLNVHAFESTQFYGNITGSQLFTFLQSQCSSIPSLNSSSDHFYVWTPRPQNVGSYSPINWPSVSSANFDGQYFQGSDFCTNSSLSYYFGSSGVGLDTDLWSSPSNGITYMFIWRNTTPIGYIQIDYNSGGSITPVAPIDLFNTRIISFTPENGTTTPSGVPVNFSLHAYVNAEDVGNFLNIAFTLHNIDQNVLLLGAFSDSDIYFLDRVVATTTGDFYYASSTIIADGNYRINAILERTFLTYLNNPYSSLNQDLSHQFVVGTSTFIGNISQNSFEQLNQFTGVLGATSTSALANTCNPVSGNVSTAFLNPNFSPIECLTFLFIPDAGYLNSTLLNFRQRVSTHFPLGYVTDFYSIVATTSSSDLVVLDTSFPSALGFGAPHIRLSLYRILDPILYATSSIYSDGTTTGATFYDFTSGYWKIIVYILALFYILIRIIGTSIIPKPFQEMSGDKSVSDESYRLKEKLYDMSQRK